MKQITEDYVSYETAQLLKEKGFDEKCIGFYTCTDHFFMEASYRDSWTYERHGSINAPTHQMALKWLREVHNIHITIHQVESTTITMEQEYFFYRIQKDRRTVGIFEDTFLKYEQAVEAAIKYTLENLI